MSSSMLLTCHMQNLRIINSGTVHQPIIPIPIPYCSRKRYLSASLKYSSNDELMMNIMTNSSILLANTKYTSTKDDHMQLSHFWREVQGSNNWENLLEPLHPLLRREIIRYGGFVTSCYEAFDLDINSKRYLNCKYGKKTMLKDVGLGDCGYDVTKYIYATSPYNIKNTTVSAGCCRWIGYVAASKDKEVKRFGRRDIVVTFRGTVTNPEWIANLMSSLTPARFDPHDPRPNVKVESGFLSLYTSNEGSSDKFGIGSCREQLLSEVSRLINKYRGEETSITITGHSMGSSLALLLAYDIAELGLNRQPSSDNRKHPGKEKFKKIPITVFSFGGPRVGNLGFKKRCEDLGVKVLRIVNVNDPVTKLPGVLFNDENSKVLKGMWSCYCYAHVGVELVLDFFKIHNPFCVHDLEGYIGLLKSPKSSSNNNLVEENKGIFDLSEKCSHKYIKELICSLLLLDMIFCYIILYAHSN